MLTVDKLMRLLETIEDRNAPVYVGAVNALGKVTRPLPCVGHIAPHRGPWGEVTNLVLAGSANIGDRTIEPFDAQAAQAMHERLSEYHQNRHRRGNSAEPVAL